MLHVVSGDVAAETMRRADLGGEVVGWKDSPATGPSPGDVDAAEYRRLRAEHRGVDVEGFQDLHDLDGLLEQEVVLWLDACPWDHALGLRLLDHLAGRARALSLVQIGEHPDVRRFVGLGQLSPAHFAALLPGRVVVDDEMAAGARRAWAAWCAADPRALRATLDEPPPRLRYAKAATARLLQELPSTWNGLSRTESNVLACVADEPLSFRSLVDECGAREDASHGLWYGDVFLWDVVRGLAGARHPLVAVEGEVDRAPSPGALVAATPAGRRALAGSFDHVVENGVDRWVGGARLRGRSTWRYDARGARLAAPR